MKALVKEAFFLDIPELKVGNIIDVEFPCKSFPKSYTSDSYVCYRNYKWHCHIPMRSLVIKRKELDYYRMTQ